MAGVPSSGAVVAWWDGGRLRYAVVAGEQGTRVRLVRRNGRECRVPASRIAIALEPRGPAPGSTPEGRKAAGQRAADWATRVLDRAEACDVAVLWEIAAEQPELQEVDTLAELAFGDATALDRAAVVEALVGDAVRFVRKGDGWEPRPAAQVEALLAERRQAEQRERERQELFAALAAATPGTPVTLPDTGTAQRYVAALRELALEDLETPEGSRTLAEEALAAARLPHDRPAEGAFRLLRALGVFASDDENLDLLRHRVRAEFPEPVLAHARKAAAAPLETAGRVDLTSLDVVTVDSPRTREIDDGLSLEIRPGGGVRLGIHVADPGARVEPDDPVDLAAAGRAVTHYLPDRKLLMIPSPLSEEAASLLPGTDRPAISFLVDLDDDGDIGDWEIVLSMVRSRARLSYDALDEGGPDPASGIDADVMARIVRLLLAREGRRVRDGAIRIPADQVDVHVDGDGTIRLERQPGDSASRRAVGEAMVLAGTLAARFCVERELPAIYRRQPGPERPPEIPDGDRWDPVTVRAVRRSLRRGEVAVRPGQHYALGVPAYAQATSPIRRYTDLATHRQIAASLRGRPLPYDVAGLRRIAATTDAADRIARRIERNANRYWRLRYLEQRRPERLVGVVVAVEPRPMVELEETLLEQAVPSLQGAEPGQRVELRIERVNPRADLLVLRP